MRQTLNGLETGLVLAIAAIGMLPLALGAAQTAPLGRAVIGGLFGGTLATR